MGHANAFFQSLEKDVCLVKKQVANVGGYCESCCKGLFYQSYVNCKQSKANKGFSVPIFFNISLMPLIFFFHYWIELRGAGNKAGTGFELTTLEPIKLLATTKTLHPIPMGKSKCFNLLTLGESDSEFPGVRIRPEVRPPPFRVDDNDDDDIVLWRRRHQDVGGHVQDFFHTLLKFHPDNKTKSNFSTKTHASPWIGIVALTLYKIDFHFFAQAEEFFHFQSKLKAKRTFFFFLSLFTFQIVCRSIGRQPGAH